MQPGDFLVFQLESGFALMRLLFADVAAGVWHVAVYGDFFPDIETAEAATADTGSLSVHSPHLAITTRAFESTQVARIANLGLTEAELTPLAEWANNPERIVSDRSVRLLLGVR